MLSRGDLHTLTGVYAVNALPYAERERFERHLRRCPACASEVRGLQRTAAELGLAAALPPPATLHDQVMAAVARTRQLPPFPEAPPRAERRSWSPGRRWYPRLVTVVAAAGIAAAVALGLGQLHAQQQLDLARAREQQIAAVLSAPDARLTAQATSTAGQVTAVVSASRRQLVVTTSGLPALPAGKVYELWLMLGGRATPAGLLPPAHGSTAAVLASGVRRGDRLGLTVEPAGGTRHPTTPPILDLPLG